MSNLEPEQVKQAESAPSSPENAPESPEKNPPCITPNGSSA